MKIKTKKLFGIIITFIISISIFNLYVLAKDNKETKTIKRIISIVYDDSTSMDENNNWEYASYSVQNMFGLMNEEDEVSVIKMSKFNESIDINLYNSGRQNDIKKVESWSTVGGTYFQAIETAGNWLRTKKTKYKDSQSVEYWLVVLTDGSFGEGVDSAMNQTFTRLKKDMENSKFEGVLVAIGNNVPNQTKTSWKKYMGNHIYEAANSKGIISVMSSVSELILGQSSSSETIKINLSKDGTSIKFKTPFPLKKFIIFEQNQNIGIKSIEYNEMKIKPVLDFNTNKPGYEKIKSRIIHCEEENKEYIKAGEITVNFDSKVDINSDKFKILIEAAIDIELKLVDKQGNLVDNPDKLVINEEDTIEFAAVAINAIDGKELDLREWSKDLSAIVNVNNQSIKMDYDKQDNVFYATYKVKEGSNLAFATVNLPGYFRAKSNILNIYPREIIETPSVSVSNNVVEVPYKYTKEYEKIGEFTYTVTGDKINGLCDFEFKNMPKGITVSVNGIFADKDGKLSVKVYNDVPAAVIFYRNKDYQEIANSKIAIDVKSGKNELQWVENSITEIILKPIKRTITIETTKTPNSNNLTLNNFDNQDIYIVSVLGNNEYLTKEELENIIIEKGKENGISLDYEVIEYNGRHALKIKTQKTLPKLFVKTGNISINLNLKTMYYETSDNFKLIFTLKDSFTKYILPIIILIIIILLIGYIPGIKKKLYNNKYHIICNNNDEAIYVKTITRLLPYVTEKGTGSDLLITATSNKNKVIVTNNFYNNEKIYLDDELIEENKNKINLPLGSKLKVVDQNRETIYIYADSHNDESISNSLSNFDDFDDMFNFSNNSTDSTDIESDFFG